MNDDNLYKSEDEEDMDISSDLASDDSDDEDNYYDPEDEGLSDFNFADDELPVEEAEDEMADAS